MLEKCVESGYAKNIELRYNSNGVELPDRLFELWENFEKVVFHFSLDSVHGMNDYIRFPSQFPQLEKQLERLDKTPDSVTVTIACAVQALNIYYIPDFIKWKLEKKLQKNQRMAEKRGIDRHSLCLSPRPSECKSSASLV